MQECAKLSGRTAHLIVESKVAPLDDTCRRVNRHLQHACHLRWAVSGRRRLLAESLANAARDTKVEKLPRRADADGVEGLHVSMYHLLSMHALEALGQI